MGFGVGGREGGCGGAGGLRNEESRSGGRIGEVEQEGSKGVRRRLFLVGLAWAGTGTPTWDVFGGRGPSSLWG